VEDRGCPHLGAGRTCAYAPEITYSGPLNAGAGFGSGERCVCPQRLRYGFADRYPDRYRFRSVGCARSAQPTDARRNCKPGRLDAVVGPVRGTGQRVSGRRTSPKRHRKGLGRGRRAVGVDRYAGRSGEIIAMHSFGASAPIGPVMKKFGFTADHVYEAARRQIEGLKQ